MITLASGRQIASCDLLAFLVEERKVAQLEADLIKERLTGVTDPGVKEALRVQGRNTWKRVKRLDEIIEANATR